VPAEGTAGAVPGDPARPRLLGRRRAVSLARRSNRAFAVVVVLLVAAAVTAAALLQVARHDRNQLLNRLDPAIAELDTLDTALGGAASGGRYYAVSHAPSFLALYRGELATLSGSEHALASSIPSHGGAERQLVALSHQITRFEQRDLGAETRPGARPSPATLHSASAALAAVRARSARLAALLAHQRSRAIGSFSRALAVLEAVVGGVFAFLLLLVAGLWLTVRRAVLAPLATVAADSRRVTGGELDHPVTVDGPEEVAELAASIDAMRAAVVRELHALESAHAELATQERALAERSEELARSNRDLEQFAYVASHDLQEPLRKVAAFCQLLADRYGDKLDERGEQYVAFAVDGAKRMQALVNDLLAFSRVGRSRENWTRVELTACVETASANLERRILEAEGRVEVTTPLPGVEGDPSLLTSLFQNLIGNAVKFRSEAPPVVSIAARRDGDHWALTVSDNGIGIEAEYAERVFTIFQRLHTRERYEGTGIGLALCRRIVEFHGGSIEVDTDTAAGTTIRFSLPAAPEAPADPEETPHD